MIKSKTMIKINLSSVAEAETDKNNDLMKITQMEEINMALKECKLGWFHVKLMVTSFFGVMAGVLVTSSTSYLLPSAECDLKMDLVQKGLLNAGPFIGMLFSSLIAGFLTDTFGRKPFLLIGFGGIFLSTIACGLSQSFIVLLIGKICEGCSFAAAFNPLVTLTSEFCNSEVRDRIMLAQSSFTAAAQTLVTLFSWAILKQDLHYSLFGGYVVLNTWNFYQLFCSLFSLLAFVLYAFLPESPKYLLTQKRYDETRDVLIKIYRTNTGKPVDTYPYNHIWHDISNKINSENGSKGLQHQIVVGLYNVKPIFKKPLNISLGLLATNAFLCMLVFNVFRLWFPQLSTIMESYSLSKDQDVCDMLDSYTYQLRILKDLTATVNTTNANGICFGKKSGNETFLNSVIISLVCILPLIISSTLVNKMGKKNLLLFGGVFTVAATLGVRWTTSKAVFLTLFASSLALTQTMMSLFQTMAIEYFPTTSRTLAIGFIMLSGRCGTLMGNILFPILFKKKCEVPFFTFAGFLSVVVVIIIFLPRKKEAKK